MADRERIAKERLRQQVCEEILAYRESIREGPDLTLTIDRIFAAFELGGYTRQPEPPADRVEVVARWLRTYKTGEVEGDTADCIKSWDKCDTKDYWRSDAREVLKHCW